MVRHSGCTSADIEFEIEAHSLVLRLNDNGKGFDVSSRSDGHGLMSMRARAGQIGGQFEVISRNGEGTTVTLRVPLGGLPRPAGLKPTTKICRRETDPIGAQQPEQLHERVVTRERF